MKLFNKNNIHNNNREGKGEDGSEEIGEDIEEEYGN